MKAQLFYSMTCERERDYNAEARRGRNCYACFALNGKSIVISLSHVDHLQLDIVTAGSPCRVAFLLAWDERHVGFCSHACLQTHYLKVMSSPHMFTCMPIGDRTFSDSQRRNVHLGLLFQMLSLST